MTPVAVVWDREEGQRRKSQGAVGMLLRSRDDVSVRLVLLVGGGSRNATATRPAAQPVRAFTGLVSQ